MVSSAAIPTGGILSGFPINYLLIEALQKIHHYYGDSLKMECPTGFGVTGDYSVIAKATVIALNLAGAFVVINDLRGKDIAK